MNKTNAMRLLDRAKLVYKTAEYPVDENDLSGTHIADEVGMPYEAVFKTLVARGDKTGVIVLCIPVDRELDLKKAARISGNKKVEMVQMKELLGLTGYIRGGCSPIGMKKKYPTFIDESCRTQAEIAVSAGIRGGQIIMDPAVLSAFVEAEMAELTV
ncbi:MAG: Cys-tRNA(Pro) deacylase [Clostridia bacterium]|nr:Cys-tRNA(Pro) deacylase [Oscillospiraceae bacterium]MBQ7033382.1 Cys-tRNA(Pro) deacylase [Clostridia bacterium]